MQGRTAQVHPHQPRNIQPPNLTQHIQGVLGVGPVHGNRPLYGVNFPLQSLGGQPRPPASHLLHRHIQQNRRHRAGCSGIPNPHLSGGKKPIPLLLQVPHQINANGNGTFRLFPAHGGPLGHIGGGPADVPLQNPLPRHRAGHPDIHWNDLRPGPPGHETHTACPLGHVLGNDGCDLLACLGNALGHHAIIGTHGNHHALGQAHLRVPRHARNPYNGIFHGPQAPQRLRQGIPVPPGRFHSPPVRRDNALYRFLPRRKGHMYRLLN